MPKWEAKVSTRLTKASADQIWPFLSDFFNLHKWFPGLANCHGVQGTNGEPGCIRYCVGFSIPPKGTAEDEKDRPCSWSKERLVSVDHVGRSLNYEIVDSNIGFTSYNSTFMIVPGVSDGHEEGCVIEWSFVVDPVEGWVFEDLVEKYEVGLKSMAKKMEDRALNLEPKWQGKASAELKGPTADIVWTFFEDFCNIDKWFPNLETCYQLEGVQGQPGLVRYCASTVPPAPGGCGVDGKIGVNWAKEKLVMINPKQRCLSYEVTENNMGIKSYVATIKVSAGNGGGENGCTIEWSFVADPIEGWRSEDFNSYVHWCLQEMAKKMEHVVQASTDN
ncbi:hypothetical protein K2173_016366 [Erythroxylum novogranatense]|uniref:Lachrymatory-factor synthase n=1 Tax=Erythroxylum novogranatense TaxID=1862640 RepID=A0AAV8SGX0_9ROSI|nr:hypothetical protein K2173_016366 [Erythroxylum novogranatense]